MEYIQYRRQREERQRRLDAWVQEEQEARGPLVRFRRPPPMERRDPLQYFSSDAFFELFRLVSLKLCVALTKMVTIEVIYYRGER